MQDSTDSRQSSGSAPRLTSKRLIVGLFRKNALRYAAGVFFVLCTTILNTQIPNLLGQLVDKVEQNAVLPGSVVTPEAEARLQAALPGIYKLVIIMAVAAFLTFVFRFVWRYFIMSFTRRLERDLREALFTHLQGLSADFYIKNNTGDIITRAISDIQAVRMMFGNGLVGMVDALAVTVVSLSYMVQTTSWQLTLVAFIPIPLLVFLLIKLRRGVRSRFLKVQEAVSSISSKVQENITGIRVIKAFAQENVESSIFSDLSKKKWEAEMGMVRLSATLSPIVQMAFGVVFSVFLVWGGSMVMDSRLTVGQYVAFNSYLLLIIEPVNTISRLVQVWQKGMVSMRRLDELFHARPSVDNSTADGSIQELSPCHLKVNHLTFTYPGCKCPSLKDIHFTIPAGGVLAVMGPTGSGKSTLANLVLRMWPLEEGKIYLGGHDISNIPLEVLRKNSAYVPQDTFLFSDTIENNIRFTDSALPFEDVQTAAAAAAVDDNIEGMPEGYKTMVGERGVTLSGGQKQRICIARALIKKPGLLVLDDCLSAVDAATEQRILSNLKVAIKGCTTLLITHRIAAASLADKILLLDEDGSVAAYGSPDELKRSNGAFIRLLRAMDAENSHENTLTYDQSESSGDLVL